MRYELTSPIKTTSSPMADNVRLGEMSGSDATNSLHRTIKEFNEASSRQTRVIIRLTWAMLALTVAIFGLTTSQVWIALR
jgi:hypothetical protein